MNDYGNEDEREARSGHRAIIQDSWERCREYLRHAEAADIHPGKSLWPTHTQQPKYQYHLAAHSSIIQFRDDILAFKNERTKNDVQALWNEEIETFAVDGDETTISLENLGELTNRHITRQQESTDPVQGTIKSETEYRILLPIFVCRSCYRHIQKVCHELGFTADTTDITPEDEASPEDLVGLLTERGQQEATSQLPERFKGN